MTLKRDQRDPSLHECGEILCKVYDQFHNEEDYHKCYMRAFTSDMKTDKFIFHDFKCIQENGIHTPNFVVAQSICSHCKSKPTTSEATCNNCGSRCQLCDKFDKKENEWERNRCPGCGKRQLIFKDPQTQIEFCKWLISEQHLYNTVENQEIILVHLPDQSYYDPDGMSKDRISMKRINVKLLTSRNRKSIVSVM